MRLGMDFARVPSVRAVRRVDDSTDEVLHREPSRGHITPPEALGDVVTSGLSFVKVHFSL